MKKFILLTLISILFFSACSFAPSKNNINRNTNTGNDFAFDFFFEILESDKNAFVSPYSLELALTMAYLGSDGKTKQEMANVLKLNNLNIEDIQERSINLMNYLSGSDDIELLIANAFYLKEEFPFLDSFIEKGQNYFEAEINNLPENGKVINDWANEKTKGKITEIIDQGPIDASIIAILLNAVYFNADWKNQFHEGSTRKKTFYGVNGETEKNMMHRKGNYFHLNEDNLKAVKLEYKNDNFSFYAFMPEDLNYFYKNFDRAYFTKIKDQMEMRQIDLYFPKFKLEKNLNLNQNLKNLGINQAFSSSSANFANLVDLKKINQNVYISGVAQNTFIEVSEKGTEAAAVTTITASKTSVQAPPPVIEFNRPFIFIIEEKETNTILFAGQLVK